MDVVRTMTDAHDERDWFSILSKHLWRLVNDLFRWAVACPDLVDRSSNNGERIAAAAACMYTIKVSGGFRCSSSPDLLYTYICLLPRVDVANVYVTPRRNHELL